MMPRPAHETPTGKIVKTVAPVLVMAIAAFMILDELRIASNIVVITYAALMGAIALGMALAFGLGGRDVAGRLLESAYTKGQEVQGTVRADVRKGVATGRSEAEEARTRISGGQEGRPTFESGEL